MIFRIEFCYDSIFLFHNNKSNPLFLLIDFRLTGKSMADSIVNDSGTLFHSNRWIQTSVGQKVQAERWLCKDRFSPKMSMKYDYINISIINR